VLIAALLLERLPTCGDDAAGDDPTFPPTGVGGIPPPLQFESHFADDADGREAGIADFTEATKPNDFVAETGVSPIGSPHSPAWRRRARRARTGEDAGAETAQEGGGGAAGDHLGR
jgi:hypothetical protein